MKTFFIYLFTLLTFCIVQSVSSSQFLDEGDSSEWVFILDVEAIEDPSSFIIAGSSHLMDENEIYYSERGVIWRPVLKTEKSSICSIVRYQKTYMAFSSNGNIYESLNGLSWSKVRNRVPMRDDNDTVGNVVVIGSAFLLSKNDSLLISGDLKSWEVVDSLDAQLYDFLSDSPVNGKIFVRTESSVYVSDSGIKWSQTNLNLDLTKKVIWEKNQYLALQSDGIIMRSVDGVYWEEYLNTELSRLNDFLSTGDIFIVVGNDGLVASSKTGKLWSKSEVDVNVDLVEVVWNGDTYVAYGRSEKRDGNVSYDFRANIIYSRNGLDWSISQKK